MRLETEILQFLQYPRILGIPSVDQGESLGRQVWVGALVHQKFKCYGENIMI
jgi:hypothetical protein